jgi:hypothetical protein
VADDDGGLRVVDVSDPAQPTEVGFYDTPALGNAWGVYVSGSTAYVADVHYGGLFILRYTGPDAPVLNAIANSDEDSDYTVTWLDVTGAVSYTLEEDDNADFTSPTTIYTGEGSQHAVSDQSEGTWYYRVRASSTAGDSNWSNVESVVVQTSEGDDHEPDDTCAQASPIATDGTVQQHTFHDQGDWDWTSFDAISGTTYVVQATSTSDDANLVLELYDACGGDQEGADNNALGSDARVVFPVSSPGTYYVKALNHDPSAYGADVTYELSVRAQSPGGVVLIVAGNNDDFDLQDNILYAANLAYRTFRSGGIPKAHIRYLSAIDDDSRTDADGDGTSDVYASSASANVEAALTTCR